MWTRRSPAGIARPENQRVAGSEPKRPTTTTTRNDTDRDNMGQLALSNFVSQLGNTWILDTQKSHILGTWRQQVRSCLHVMFIRLSSKPQGFSLLVMWHAVLHLQVGNFHSKLRHLGSTCGHNMGMRRMRVSWFACWKVWEDGKLVIGDAAANDIDSWCEILRQLESQSEG